MKKGKFKEKHTYYLNMILLSVLVIGFLYLLIFLIIKSDDEIIKLFGERELYGRAKKKGAILIGRFLVIKYGKLGVVIPSILMVFGSLWFLSKETFEFSRFLYKEKLFKQGIADDMYDDYKSTSIFKRLRNLFGSKSKKYPSNKTIRKESTKNKYPVEPRL